MSEKKLNTLLIEDNPDHAMIIRRILCKCTQVAKVQIASDGQRAINLLKDTGNSTLPDLVILDIKLPKVSGFEVLSIYKNNERSCHIPIIVLSTSGIDRDKTKALALGADYYLIKPNDFQILHKQFCSILSKISTGAMVS